MFFTVDEGSYEPNQVLQKIRAIAEEALESAHQLGLVKTQKEAEKDAKSDDES